MRELRRWVCYFILITATADFNLACNSSPHDASTMASAHSVTLNWQASRGAKYYLIYRSSDPKSGYQKIGTSPTTTYKDGPVPAGSTFYYEVTAVNDKGESNRSGEIKAVVP